MPPKKSTTATKAASKTATKSANTTTAKTATKAAPAKTTTKAQSTKDAPKKATATKKAPSQEKPTKSRKAAKENGVKASPAPASRKRKSDSEPPTEVAVNGTKTSNASGSSTAVTKKRKAGDAAPSAAAAKRPRTATSKAVINQAPTQRLHVFTFGTGDTGGELGLGQYVRTVKRPRLNPHLLAKDIGVVQVACGGMHCAALTHDNKIYTWGVNDHGALGRETNWEGGLKDINGNGSDSDSDEDEAAMNPYESTPTAIDQTAFPENTLFTQLACCDSSTFALTNEGLVYGWGTFKSSDGVIGFSPESLIQTKPTLVTGLKKIKKLVSGGNHVLALSSTGQVYAWGSGEKNQLGRRIVERTKQNGLIPREFGLPKGITDIGAGSYHNFALHEKTGKVYAWGLNNFGQTGIPEGVGEDEAVVLHPSVIQSLSAKGDTKVTNIDGGEHHSIAVQADGACLTWGRLDGYQAGMKVDTLPSSDTIKDERGNVRILKHPTFVPAIGDATYGCAGSRHTIAVARDGKAYSWGTNNTYQCGQGNDDDVEVATHIDNTAVRGKQLNWAGASAQFSALTALASKEDLEMVNGV